MNIMKYIAVCGLMLTCGQVSALEFKQLLPNESTVTFGYKQMGVSLDGKFNKFAAQLAFDPAKISAAQARIDINVASIDTGSMEANDEVVGKLWFNAKTFPAASFVSTGLKALGGNRYEATGKLSIKGRMQEVKAPVTFQATGNRGAFDGSFTIKRLDFAIGEGEWTDIGTVANEIQIKFHLVVNAVPGKP
jgi:polyisoprenoid-binding protein YceI